MRVIPINQMTTWARVWSWKRFRFVWYRVGRAGEDWRPLEIGQAYVKPKKFDLDKVVKKLNKGQPTVTHNTILDEDAADREVAKNTPHAKKQ